ncbi:MAG: hypothetical protein CR967_05805 [Proteobacteria bacterium]|nr:MAG: hypothetical protein CR967_05805 [Pseudomonadota bacterium]
MKYTKLTIKINTKDKPPYFLGSQLRGAFGYALKNIYSHDSSKESLFYKFYEEQNIQRAFRFDYVLGQYEYEFDFYLFDKYCDEVSFVINAFDKMLSKVGLGKDRKTYKNYEIYLNDKDKKLDFSKKYTKKIKIKKHFSKVEIELKTPLRIKKDNRFIRNSSIELEDILTSIHKKIRFLKGEEVYRLDFKPSYTYKAKDVYFKDLSRYSLAKNEKMKFGGLVGSLHVDNLDKKSYKLLKMGEILGVGKETSFGLGKIIVKEEYE